MILDTNFLIDIDANRPEAIEKAREIEDAGVPRRVPHVVVFELWTAVGKGNETEANRRKFERVLDGLPRAETTDSIVKRAGEIEGRVQAADPNDSGVGVADAVIAATAVHLGEPVVTDDGDFRRRIKEQANVDTLEIEEYA
ncbi:PIN domain-containing protein [Halolamina sediminis]|uniref:PIN domain-containing protein n=1 Tax=Halolamina sediminis TaxID=1480675 RepID=UPI0006B5C475|nr:PIN domain-containing protein [Halolamina sediminis]